MVRNCPLSCDEERESHRRLYPLPRRTAANTQDMAKMRVVEAIEAAFTGLRESLKEAVDNDLLVGADEDTAKFILQAGTLYGIKLANLKKVQDAMDHNLRTPDAPQWTRLAALVSVVAYLAQMASNVHKERGFGPFFLDELAPKKFAQCGAVGGRLVGSEGGYAGPSWFGGGR